MKIEKLPKKIAIFPLSNAVFFPKTILPLNIFEKRYIELVNDTMKEESLFGMVQPKSAINLKPEVMPLSNIPCYLSPFILNFSKAVVACN